VKNEKDTTQITTETKKLASDATTEEPTEATTDEKLIFIITT
jgi:hypothetical protein